MRFKVLTLLALLAMLLGMTACGRKAMPTRPATTDLPDIALVPYSSQEFGFTGVMPAARIEFSPGHFQPEMPSTEPTLFVQLGLPGATMEQINELAALPESVGSRETSSLTWDPDFRGVFRYKPIHQTRFNRGKTTLAVYSCLQLENRLLKRVIDGLIVP